LGCAAGLKAWPRGLRPLRCSLDSARNDSYENVFVKRATLFYWLICIAIAAIAIAAAFYLDDTVWNFITHHQSHAMRNFMRDVSLFGDWPSHVALGLLFLGIAWIRGSKEWTRIFLAMLIAMSIAGVTGLVIKRTIPRPRPSVQTNIRWGGSRLSSKYHSFPSGHVGTSTAFFATLFFARRRIGLACLPIPILIAFSRMYIGAHYLSDVVCAALLGTLCALLVTHFFLRQIENRRSQIGN
jgi:membrane-associated phospholipid phosphatase